MRETRSSAADDPQDREVRFGEGFNAAAKTVDVGISLGHLGQPTFPRNPETATALDGAFATSEIVGAMTKPAKTAVEQGVDVLTGVPLAGKALTSSIKAFAACIGLSKDDETDANEAGDAPGTSHDLTRIHLLLDSYQRTSKPEPIRIDRPADVTSMNTESSDKEHDDRVTFCARCEALNIDSTHDCSDMTPKWRSSKFDRREEI